MRRRTSSFNAMVSFFAATLCAILLSIPAPVLAEDIDRSSIAKKTFGLILPYNVEIVNQAHFPVQYSIRPQDGTWGNFELRPNYRVPIGCGDCTAEFFEILIVTGDKQVNYFLPHKHRYAIYWNGKEQKLDVYRMTKMVGE